MAKGDLLMSTLTKKLAAQFDFYFFSWGYFYFSAGYFCCKQNKLKSSSILV